jgi:hemerythrin-like domain-containing protein
MKIVESQAKVVFVFGSEECISAEMLLSDDFVMAPHGSEAAENGAFIRKDYLLDIKDHLERVDSPLFPLAKEIYADVEIKKIEHAFRELQLSKPSEYVA